MSIIININGGHRERERERDQKIRGAYLSAYPRNMNFLDGPNLADHARLCLLHQGECEIQTTTIYVRFLFDILGLNMNLCPRGEA